MKSYILALGAFIVGATLIYILVTPDPVVTGQRAAFERMSDEEAEEGYIYETEADSAEDCSSYEAYDDEAGVCYFECTDEAECDAIEADIEEELGTLADAYAESDDEFAESDSGEGPTVVATYRVSQPERITLTDGTPDEQHQRVWSLFARISPDAFTNAYVNTFEIANDASDDTLAYVHDDDGDGYWSVGVNVGSFGAEGKREDILTLIHEFAHIVTLNQTQVIHGGTCITYDTGDGCATAQSYLHAFVQRFWPESERTRAVSGEDVYARAAHKYLTEYAATSPEEDIAESFALFVLESSKREGATVADQKAAFFYAYPELVTLRNTIRKGLGSILLERKRVSGSN
jgi:hypothetical protein